MRQYAVRMSSAIMSGANQISMRQPALGIWGLS